ncbi:MAG: polysaccharide deacetylase family protein [Candidatus Merdivicinus sp.]
MIYQKLYPDGKAKALTFSYDDGVIQDITLTRLFNRYQVKATFNLNSGLDSSSSWEYKGAKVSRISPDEMPAVYDGHEVAVHSRTHPHLEQVDQRKLYAELYEDRVTLSARFRCKVSGMALPYGSWNDDVMEAIEKLGFLYCRNTVSTHSFELPENLLQWAATCHHNDPELMMLAESFRVTDEELALFYVWGHAYEFDGNQNWQVMEEFLEETAGRRDTWYATNHEVAAYLNAAKRLIAGDDFFLNPTDMDLWVRVEGTTHRIPAGKWVNL